MRPAPPLEALSAEKRGPWVNPHSPPLREAAEDGQSQREIIAALAELTVTLGANIQPGQDVEVSAEVGHLDSVRAIVKAAYRRGARFVDVHLSDPVLQRARIAHGPAQELDYVPGWEAKRIEDLALREGASILLTGPTIPNVFDDLDPAQVARAAVGPSAQWRAAEPNLNWTIVPAGSPGWARELRPGLPEADALRALWREISYACRLDEPDPIATWRARLQTLTARAQWLTSLDLATVHLQGPGTDLTVGLPADVRWDCPQMRTRQGIEFHPNLPTEEVYTTPEPARVDGHVRLTRPVSIAGLTIPDVSISFTDGHLTDISGPAEVSALREFAARDHGSSRLGELALVDRDSRVAALATTFGDTLLDENAASHIALGQGFTHLMPRTNPAGANSSAHHLDLMFGCPQMRITGVDRQNQTHSLMSEGHWQAP